MRKRRGPKPCENEKETGRSAAPEAKLSSHVSEYGHERESLPINLKHGARVQCRDREQTAHCVKTYACVCDEMETLNDKNIVAS